MNSTVTTTITKELTQPPANALFDLDPSLFQPSPEECEFLRATVATDDEEIRKKVFGIQKE